MTGTNPISTTSSADKQSTPDIAASPNVDKTHAAPEAIDDKNIHDHSDHVANVLAGSVAGRQKIVIIISAILIVSLILGIIVLADLLLLRQHRQPQTRLDPRSNITLSESGPHEAGQSAVITAQAQANAETYMSIMGQGNATITYDQQYRYVNANGIPDHQTGQFPNQQNPSEIASQQYDFRLPLLPAKNSQPQSFNLEYDFGVALNGVPFDPWAAEWYQNDRNSGWQLEAIGNLLGLDFNNAHVQPNGSYHYHGLPTSLLSVQHPEQHSALLGFAADGFPIYAQYGYQIPDNPQSSIIELRSSYQLRVGTRSDGPGGVFDGTYVQDYAYTAGLGDLDECNGRNTVTPEYPAGTYAYFITADFPYIPRCFWGTPDESFRKSLGQSLQNEAPPARSPQQDPPNRGVLPPYR